MHHIALLEQKCASADPYKHHARHSPSSSTREHTECFCNLFALTCESAEHSEDFLTHSPSRNFSQVATEKEPTSGLLCDCKIEPKYCPLQTGFNLLKFGGKWIIDPVFMLRNMMKIEERNNQAI